MTVSTEPRKPQTVDASRQARVAERWAKRRGGWPRVVRNCLVGYFQQAGGRMAAALAFYSLILGAPSLVLTLALGSALFGEEASKDAVLGLLPVVLPPQAGGGPELAREVIGTSRPTVGLALVGGLSALYGFTRALTTSISVTLRAEGTEPHHRTLMVGPLLLVATVGLIWGGWAFKPLAEMARQSLDGLSGAAQFAVDVLAPLLLAFVFLATILTVIPRMHLERREILVPALVGATLWEATRHLFAWLAGPDNVYLQVFGPFGGIFALLGWVYLSSNILVLTGQLAWAYAMECRGRGDLACQAPRQAGPEGWLRPFEGEHAVNEDQGR